MTLQQRKQGTQMTNTTQIQEAMEYAYRALGIKDFTVLGGSYTSPSQHSMARTKEIQSKANAYLLRRNLDITLSILRSSSGQCMHSIQ